MSQQWIKLINGYFKNRTERLKFWLHMEPGAPLDELARLSVLKNARVASSIISRQKLRK